MLLLSGWRMARAVTRGSVAKRGHVGRLPMVVRWADCDLNLHMTNARYLQVMDAGRLELVFRSGTWRALLREGLRPAVVELHLRYLRELRPGQRYELDTRMVGTRGKATLIEQTFLVGDRVHAHAEVAALLLKGRRVVPPAPFEPMIEPPLERHGGDRLVTDEGRNAWL